MATTFFTVFVSLLDNQP